MHMYVPCLASAAIIESHGSFGSMGKQGASRYRGVTRPGDGSLGWVAQKRGICYAARFTSEAKAAKWLAERLGVSVSSLRQTTLPSSEVRESYRGVVYHSGCWEARLRGGVVLGYFGSQDEAVRKLMRETGMTRKQLRKKDFSTKTLRTRFKCKHRLFGSYEPGDVRTMCEHESKSASIYRQDKS